MHHAATRRCQQRTQKWYGCQTGLLSVSTGFSPLKSAQTPEMHLTWNLCFALHTACIGDQSKCTDYFGSRTLHNVIKGIRLEVGLVALDEFQSRFGALRMQIQVDKEREQSV